MNRCNIFEYDLAKMDFHTGAGLILWSPDRSAVLLVLDDRSNKWSFPKGRIESHDITLLHTMIREIQEETRLCYMVDYNLHADSPMLYTFGKGMHCLFEATAVHTTLAPPNHDEHILEIRYVPLSEIPLLRTNLYVSTWLVYA
jgi:8-oxo-dGTP pyrophosphatase MutT (NUDIX family)